MRTQQLFAETYEATNDEYHADFTRISNSMRKVFTDSRRLYEGRFITDTVPPRTATTALEIGTIAHAAILEPHIVERVCVPIPPGVLNEQGHRKGANWKAFEASLQPDQIAATPGDLRLAMALRDACMKNPGTRKWLEMEGPSEQSIRWQDAATGLQLRCRPDKRTTRCIVDVKTTRNSSPIEFSKSCAQFAYAEQATFYQNGVAALLQGEILPVVFIAVSKEPPYVARAYELDEAAMDYARERVAKSLEDLAHCYGANDWREPGEEEVMELSLPNWAFFKEQWEN